MLFYCFINKLSFQSLSLMYISKCGFCCVLFNLFSLFCSALNLAEMAAHAAAEKEMLLVVSTYASA